VLLCFISNELAFHTYGNFVTNIGACLYSTINNMHQNIQKSEQHYSPGWALASSTICLQASQFLALSLQLLTSIFLRSMDTSSSHLILGLPLRLVAYSFPYNICYGKAVSCILSICPSHRILRHLINLTIFSPMIMVYNSSFAIIHFLSQVRIVFRKYFLSNIANVLSSSTVSVHDSEPQVTTGRTKVWCICKLLLLDMRLILNSCLLRAKTTFV
jgi:hypothetical protein